MAPFAALLRALLAAAALGSFAAGAGAAGEQRITALQWNPHWECFAKSPSCGQQVQRELHSLLFDERLDLDFANVIELENLTYSPPPGWGMIGLECGRDMATFLYNSRRWRLVAAEGAASKGCMARNDRPHLVQAFEHLSGNFRLVAVGAHFPHLWQYPAGVRTLRSAIRSVTAAVGAEHLLLIADTNLNATNRGGLNGSSDSLFRSLGVPELGPVMSTDLIRSCCLDDGFHFTFDRVIANFGSEMSTRLLFDPTPEWAVGEFHKAVVGSLTLSPPVVPSPERGAVVEYV